jgi:hypothetical protein
LGVGEEKEEFGSEPEFRGRLLPEGGNKLKRSSLLSGNSEWDGAEKSGSRPCSSGVSSISGTRRSSNSGLLLPRAAVFKLENDGPAANKTP